MLISSEKKIDNTFPVSQFCVLEYSVSFSLDRTGNGVGIMLHVKEHITSRMLRKFKKQVEAFALEINRRKVKWLLVCFYNPNFSNLPVHLNAIDKAIEFFSKTYEQFLVAGDFHTQESDIKLDIFCSI